MLKIKGFRLYRHTATVAREHKKPVNIQGMIAAADAAAKASSVAPASRNCDEPNEQRSRSRAILGTSRRAAV